jgi:hypothetical protein
MINPKFHYLNEKAAAGIFNDKQTKSAARQLHLIDDQRSSIQAPLKRQSSTYRLHL